MVVASDFRIDSGRIYSRLRMRDGMVTLRTFAKCGGLWTTLGPYCYRSLAVQRWMMMESRVWSGMIWFGPVPISLWSVGRCGRCDLFKGRWIPNPSGPLYNKSCPVIDDTQNCLNNGRPDNQYLYWRWKPYFCDLPLFDPAVFMNAFRDKSWVFIGDSILRNQMQSMLCLLSKVEEPVEIYHDKAFKSRTFYFSNHNLTVAIIWAPFLVKSTVNEDDGKSKSEIQLHLDVLEANWTTSYKKHDYVVISGGQWLLKTIVMWENDSAIGCHNCEEKNLKELGTDYPYHKALRLAFDIITSSDHKPYIFFRTWTLDHFEHGEWFNGGVCNRSQPYREGQFNGKPADNPKRKVELEEYKMAKLVALERGINMELVDVYHMSLLRPDGHLGPYRTYHPFDKNKSAIVQNDCLHWCLPGPVDAWNELVMKILYNSGVLNYSTTLYRKDPEGLGRISFQ